MGDDFKRDMITYTLSRSVFGSELKKDDLARFAEVCALRRIDKNSYLFRQEEPATGFYVVQSGAIKVHRLLPEGREQVIRVFRSPESFAEIVLSGVDHYPVSASAVESSQVIHIDRVKLSQLLRQVPDLALHLMASMSLHLKYLVERVDQQKHKRADCRLAAWLLEQFPTGTDRFKLPMKKKTLAAQLDITSETLSRTLRLFKRNGWIEERDSELILLNRGGLEANRDNINSPQKS